MRPLEIEGCETKGTYASWATLSTCGRYRYALGRSWDDDENPGSIFSIIMLNPSTAHERIDDPTIRKCIHFAKQEGCGSLFVRNLFAWRATNPRLLRNIDDPVGPFNLDVLSRDIGLGLRVAAWGQLGAKWLRQAAISPLGNIRGGATHVLSLTDHGYDRSSHFASERTRQPRHPLYLRNDTRVIQWALAC